MRVFRDIDSLPNFERAVVTIGSFDGVHLGHQKILARMQSLARDCGGETVIITFDPHPRTVLQQRDDSFRLLSTTEEKIQLLAGLGVENTVIVPFSAAFSMLSATDYVEQFLLRRFDPRYIVIGYDHRFGAKREGDIAFLKKYARPGTLDVVEIPAHEIDEMAVSSTKIRKALEQADLGLANRLLGHPFLCTGTVTAGDRIGRTIGFPTANIALGDPHKLVLPNGIYAARATLPDGRLKTAMLYIGDRPTIGAGGPRVVEANILDFEGDLYGQVLSLEVLDYVRADKKQDSLEAMKAQIEQDKAEIVRRMGTAQPAPNTSPQAQPGAPSVAVVILNYNTRHHLELYLPSVIRHSGTARIVVADNGSPDDSVAYLREKHPEVEVLELKQNHGFAEGYNQALRQVQADIYVILNSDVEVTAGWMEPIVSAMQADERIAVAQPKILAWTDKKRFEYAGAAGGWIDILGYPFCRGRIFDAIEEDQGQYDTPQACFWASGAAFFIRAELYHAYGGFDGDYFAHNEEIDLCWRLQRAGYAVWCFPASRVYHLGGGTLEYENPRKVFLNFRNSLYTLIKNESVTTLFWLLPTRFILDGVAGARFMAKGQWNAAWAIVRAHFSLYGTLGSTLRKRRDISLKINTVKKYSIQIKGAYPKSIIISYYIRRKNSFKQILLSNE